MKWNARLKEKVYESISSVVPITAIVLILSVSIAPMTPGALVLFLFGALILVFGMGVFYPGGRYVDDTDGRRHRRCNE